LGLGISVTLIASVLISLTWMPYAMIWLVPPRQSEVTKKNRKMPRWWKPKRWIMHAMHWRHKTRWITYVVIALTIGIPVYLIKDTPRTIQQGAIPTAAVPDSSLITKFRKAYIANRDKI